MNEDRNDAVQEQAEQAQSKEFAQGRLCLLKMSGIARYGLSKAVARGDWPRMRVPDGENNNRHADDDEEEWKEPESQIA
jgi:hypothetical protein